MKLKCKSKWWVCKHCCKSNGMWFLKDAADVRTAVCITDAILELAAGKVVTAVLEDPDAL